MADPRLTLAAGITGALNGGKKVKDKFVVVPDERSIATIDRRTVIVSLQGFEPLAAAPLSGLNVGFIVRVISPLSNLIAAEGDAWDAATDVAFAIETIPGVTYIRAKKVLHADRYLAYDLEVEADAKKKEV